MLQTHAPSLGYVYGSVKCGARDHCYLRTNTNILHLIKRVYVFTDTAFAEGTSTSLEIPTTQWFSSLRKLDPMHLEALVLPPLVANGP